MDAEDRARNDEAMHAAGAVVWAVGAWAVTLCLIGGGGIWLLVLR